MQTVSVRQLVKRIHDEGRWFSLVISGGAGAVVSWLLEVPGASRSVAEIVIPYHGQAFDRFLGYRPEQYCCGSTARALAVVAFWRLRQLLGSEAACVGVGCTASLVTDRPKRGAHRVHVAFQTENASACFHLQLTKDIRPRVAEDQLASRIVLLAMAEACGLPLQPALPLRAEEKLERRLQLALPEWTQVFLGQRPWTLAQGQLPVGTPAEWAILAGSFYPLHAGHVEMARLAGQLLRRPVVLELSLQNADKPPLDYLTLAERLQTVPNDWAVLLTRAPTFVEKARLFPGAVFIVGVDTLARIADPRFYGNEQCARDQALAEMARLGCRFLVFGRKVGSQFLTLADLDLPTPLRELCQGVPEEIFRMDISSTEIRRRWHESQDDT